MLSYALSLRLAASMRDMQQTDRVHVQEVKLNETGTLLEGCQALDLASLYRATTSVHGQVEQTPFWSASDSEYSILKQLADGKLASHVEDPRSVRICSCFVQLSSLHSAV